MSWENLKKLNGIIDLQSKIEHIHPFLQKLFPVVVVDEDCFLIFDVVANTSGYQFIRNIKAPIPVPLGVRAAFNLQQYEDRMVCVVTPDVFDQAAGYVTIFHEFVHCQQAENGEQKLKADLQIARKALAAGDFMWEIDHPFPFQDPDFYQLYKQFLGEGDLLGIQDIRNALKRHLQVEDYEYMVWQEWKEGFSRYIENQINNRLGLPENHGGSQQPFTRVVFYEGGAHFIHLLEQSEPDLLIDQHKLFRLLFGAGSISPEE